MTPGEFSNILDGYTQRQEREAKAQDHLNYLLGQYVAAGVNSPKDYPDKPFLSEERNDKSYLATTDEQRLIMARTKYGKKK